MKRSNKRRGLGWCWALCLALTLVLAWPAYAVDLPQGRDFSGETVILRTNDTHGRVDDFYGLCGGESFEGRLS